MSFSVATYNVLADSYVRRDYYPRVEPGHLEPAWRRPALLDHVERLDADLLCLQEVEPPLFAALDERLGARGYFGQLALKVGGKPDGCATFYRASLEVHAAQRVVYADGSGHVALVLELEHEGRALTVANTHLKWDPPATPLAERHGLRQAAELLARVKGTCIVCGDLNATPASEVVRTIEARGLRDPFGPGAFTSNANGARKRIDYVFTSDDLVARPRPVPPLEDDTPLPHAKEPSDHLALVAFVEWA